MWHVLLFVIIYTYLFEHNIVRPGICYVRSMLITAIMCQGYSCHGAVIFYVFEPCRVIGNRPMITVIFGILRWFCCDSSGKFYSIKGKHFIPHRKQALIGYNVPLSGQIFEALFRHAQSAIWLYNCLLVITAWDWPCKSSIKHHDLLLYY